MRSSNNQNRIPARTDGSFVSSAERDELLLAMALKIEELESRIRRLEAASLWTFPRPS